MVQVRRIIEENAFVKIIADMIQSHYNHYRASQKINRFNALSFDRRRC